METVTSSDQSVRRYTGMPSKKVLDGVFGKFTLFLVVLVFPLSKSLSGLECFCFLT